MTKIASAFFITAILATLAGCSSYRTIPERPRYLPPEGAPTAQLKSDIWGATNHNESIKVFATEGSCGGSASRQLFAIYKSKSSPDGYIKVAANQPLTVEYVEEASGHRTCNISLVVNLEAGKTYSLAGGFHYESGAIPILSGTRMCQLGIRDDADKRLVPSTRACAK